MTAPDTSHSHPSSTLPIRTHLTPLDLPVDLITCDGLIAWLEAAASDGGRRTVLASNAHAVKLLVDTPAFTQCHRDADLVVCDGFPVLKAALRRHARDTGSRAPAADRIGSTDWIPRLGECPSITRILLVGGRANAAAVSALSSRWPDKAIHGMEGAAWDLECERDLRDHVRALRPDLILVGLGTPLQENVIARVSPDLPPAIWAGVGGAIDQIGGAQRNAPRWMGPLGLEWLYRLATQPTRLAHRYLVEPWGLLAALTRLSLAARRVDIQEGAAPRG